MSMDRRRDSVPSTLGDFASSAAGEAAQAAEATTALACRPASPRTYSLHAARDACLGVMIVCAVVLGACVPPRESRCQAGERALVSELLYFGLAKPDGTVSAAEWSAFLQSSVTPRFPDGLTAWEATGQWQAADGSITRERAYVLNLLHAEAASAEAAVRDVVADYKARFKQEAVLRVRGRACASMGRTPLHATRRALQVRASPGTERDQAERPSSDQHPCALHAT
jgi:hypothetical protein